MSNIKDFTLEYKKEIIHFVTEQYKKVGKLVEEISVG